jgi:plasmid stabilization system protein ParE
LLLGDAGRIPPGAEADLAAIALFIAEHSPERALAFVAKLRTRCRILSTAPEAGRPRPDLAPRRHSLVERPYIIL